MRLEALSSFSLLHLIGHPQLAIVCAPWGASRGRGGIQQRGAAAGSCWVGSGCCFLHRAGG
jgi:hypothetical protein